MDPWVGYHGMKAYTTKNLWSKYECFLKSGCQDMDLENSTTEVLHFGDVLDFDL